VLEDKVQEGFVGGFHHLQIQRPHRHLRLDLRVAACASSSSKRRTISVNHVRRAQRT
jgi:hypothetical protein